MPMNILYQDKYLVVAVKPVGVLSEDDPKAACMPALLREHYRALGEKDYIATVHRLDRVTGGVMVFSRRKEITGKLTVAQHRTDLEAEFNTLIAAFNEVYPNVEVTVETVADYTKTMAVRIAGSRVASVCSGLGLVFPSVMDEPFGVSVSPSCQPGMVISSFSSP